MNINLNTSIDFSSPKIQEYIYDSNNNSTLALEPIAESGYTHDAADRRLNSFFPTIKQDVPFLIAEEWAVEEIVKDTAGRPTGRIQSGINTIDVVLAQRLDVNIEYWVYFKENISADAKNYGRSLISTYDPGVHGDDLQAWIKTQLNDVLKEDMFTIEACIHINKDGNRQELNIKQREALFSLYGQTMGETRGNIDVIDGEGEYEHWARGKNLNLRKVGEYLKEKQAAPAITRNVREVEQPKTADSVADNIIDEILTELVPSECISMVQRRHRLLTLYSWPEFKIVWKKKRIKVGCSKIIIYYPVLMVRISRMVFYVYYSLPTHVDLFILKIAETCAIRSALGAGIIGIIMSNPAVAIAAFKGLFKRCLEQEIKSCVNSGLLTVRETGSWG